MPPKRGSRSRLRLTAPEATRFSGPVVGQLANQLRQPVEQLICTGDFYEVTSGTMTGTAPKPTRFFTFNRDPAATVGLQVVAVEDTVDWTNFAAVFDEYRVLGLEVHVAPMAAAETNVLANVVYMSAFRGVEDAPDQPTTRPAVLSYGGGRFCNSSVPTSMSIKMDGTDEADWLSTDASSLRTVKYTGVAITPLQALSLAATEPNAYDVCVQVSWRVQFRSIKPGALTAARVKQTEIVGQQAADGASDAQVAQLADRLVRWLQK